MIAFFAALSLRAWLTAGLAALVLAGLAGLGVGSYRAGQKAERGVWQAAQAAEVLRVGAQYQIDLQAARKAATAAITEARAARTVTDQLQQEIAHVRVPLVVAPAQRKLVSCAGAVAAPLARVVARSDAARAMGPAARAPEPLAAPGPEALAADAGEHLWLSQSAVRLWNSALAGRELPAGACRAAEPESAACAAAGSATLDAAFANHAENALRCTQDRGQLDRLTAYLREREARRDAATAAP